MNLFKLIWCEKQYFQENLLKLKLKRLEVEDKISYRKKLIFDLYYSFSRDFLRLSYNEQWKELTLAVQIMEFIRYWDRTYYLLIEDKVDTSIFINYFRKRIISSQHNMNSIGIPYTMNNNRATIKTIIEWTNKLRKLKIIGDTKLNMFLEEIEIEHPVWIEDLPVKHKLKYKKLKEKK